MIEKRVPEDVRKFKIKTFGPLTTRNLLTVLFAGVCVLIGYFTILLPLHLTDFYSLFIGSFLFASPCIIFIFIDSTMDMPAEQIIKIFIRYILAKPWRVEQTTFSTIAPKKKEKKNKISKKEILSHPEYKGYK